MKKLKKLHGVVESIRNRNHEKAKEYFSEYISETTHEILNENNRVQSATVKLKGFGTITFETNTRKSSKSLKLFPDEEVQIGIDIYEYYPDKNDKDGEKKEEFLHENLFDLFPLDAVAEMGVTSNQREYDGKSIDGYEYLNELKLPKEYHQRIAQIEGAFNMKLAEPFYHAMAYVAEKDILELQQSDYSQVNLRDLEDEGF